MPQFLLESPFTRLINFAVNNRLEVLHGPVAPEPAGEDILPF